MKLFIGVCILVSLAATLGAAELEPGLSALLSSAPADTQLSVIAKLFNPHDIQALDQKLHAEKATLAVRHKTVIDALQDNARLTQKPVLDRLSRFKSKGLVRGYTAYWIENLIVVSGTPDAISTLATDPAIESIGMNFRAELIEPVRGPIRTHGAESLDQHAVAVGQKATGAARVNRELGITGLGTIIAGLDTGVDRRSLGAARPLARSEPSAQRMLEGCAGLVAERAIRYLRPRHAYDGHHVRTAISSPTATR